MKRAGASAVRESGPPGGHEAVADSLRRYPKVGEAERRVLLAFVRRASRTELRDAVLRRGLEGRLIAFRADHRRELRSFWQAWSPWIFALLLLATLVQQLM